jgi:hypothetical protein
MNFHKFQTSPSFSTDNVILGGEGHPVVEVAARSGPDKGGAPPLFHSTAERDPVWEPSYFEEY